MRVPSLLPLLPCLLLYTLQSSSVFSLSTDEVFFSFQINELSALNRLVQHLQLSIDSIDVATRTVTAYASTENFQALLEQHPQHEAKETGSPSASLPSMFDVLSLRGSIREAQKSLSLPKADSSSSSSTSAVVHSLQLRQRPSETGEAPVMSDKLTATSDVLSAYPTYEGYKSLVRGLAALRPDLCRVEKIGDSVLGREILLMRVSGDANDDKPSVLLDANMHGDEVVGLPLSLKLVQTLLQGYDSDARLKSIVNSSVLWFIPLRNPDGTYAGGDTTIRGARRFNSNWLDLNRNHPYMLMAEGPPGGRPIQTENEVFLDFVRTHNFTLGVNMHGGAEVINYPWDSIQERHPDDAWWRRVAKKYADAAHAVDPRYMSRFDNGITNGYDWYSVWGGEQDYMNHFRNTRMFTLELSRPKMPPARMLPFYWDRNKEGLLGFIEEAAPVFESLKGEAEGSQGEEGGAENEILP